MHLFYPFLLYELEKCVTTNNDLDFIQSKLLVSKPQNLAEHEAERGVTFKQFNTICELD